MATKALVKSEDTAQHNELVQLVSFMLADEEYGVEVLKVREIIRMPTITKMPNVLQYVEGIINLRGKVIPIISMRKRFGLQESENNSQTRIIIMDVAGSLTGFIVDGVSEVIRVHSSEIQPPPFDGALRRYRPGVHHRCLQPRRAAADHHGRRPDVLE